MPPFLINKLKKKIASNNRKVVAKLQNALSLVIGKCILFFFFFQADQMNYSLKLSARN